MRELKLGVISNFDGRLHGILDDLGIMSCFDLVVSSSDVGVWKPSPEIFEVALRRAECNARHALHVGDEPAADWHGAGRAGMQVFELQRPEVSLADLEDLFPGAVLGVECS